ncbi:MAG: GNAT family N-acetyltransferase [Geminicoccaceae bacterium]
MAFDLRVRPAVAADADILFSFVSGLIEDHFPGQVPWTSASQLCTDGFGADPLFEALIAEFDKEAVGMVSYFRGYAGMRGRAMGLVHALYVLPSARRRGVARALMSAVSRIALDRRWCRLELFVEEGLPALDFYQSLGMVDLHHRHFRLDGAALERLALPAAPQA